MLTIDHTNAMAEAVGPEHGVTAGEIADLTARFPREHRRLTEWRAKSGGTFLELPDGMAVARRAADWGAGARQRFDDFVVLGIGGSALGASCLLGALADPFHNELPAHRRSGCRLWVVDNVDPDQLAALFEALDLSRACFNVISKSGGTTETAAQFMLARERLKRAFGADWKRHVVVTTDPAKGSLRAWCRAEGLETFDVPPDVGGRFSVLSAVGLVPAAAFGADPARLLAGAREAREACLSPAAAANPAWVLAGLAFLLDRRHGKRVSVLMPYSARLRRFADWYAQLWAESLGKRLDTAGAVVHAGQTPLPAAGVTDQHSQAQLFVEGPNDKVTTFLEVEKFDHALAIPAAEADGETAHLAGRDFADLMRAERLGTAYALTAAGRPNLTVTVPAVNEETLGALLFTYEVATAFAGFLYQVDPFNQPGVEMGKVMTFARLGRKGFEKEAAELDRFLSRGGGRDRGGGPA
ncbi:MAG: glucose-6-phosphate isomerase [Planctomycetes bacterium]|nr:glucose-6-phosphate isomerase [Planctomycetota bacterium]